MSRNHDEADAERPASETRLETELTVAQNVAAPATNATGEKRGTTRTAPIDDKPVSLDAGLLLALSAVIVAISAMHNLLDAHFDFGVFYYAAHMVTDGARKLLFDLPAQHAFQSRFHRPPELLFYYPPFVLIPFIALAKLPITAAFAVWTTFSVALLYLSVRALARWTGLQFGNWPVLLSLAFMPVVTSLANGQLSILVLSAYVGAYSLWRKDRWFLGGLVLSVAAFKVQLVLGFLGMLLLKRRWRELAGFSCGGAVFAVASLLIAGVDGMLRYLPFVHQIEGGPGSEPYKMACWRGLLSLLGLHHWAIVPGLSLLTVWFAARLWTDLAAGFSAAVLASMLVAYHFSISDLSLLLIPVFLCFKRIPRQAAVVAGLLMAPEIVSLFGSDYALLAIPLVAALWYTRIMAGPQLLTADR